MIPALRDLGRTAFARAQTAAARHLHKRRANPIETRAMIALSFDDVPASTASVGMSILASFDASATFFVSGACAGDASGRWMGPDTLRQAAESGHEIGCHGYAHADYQTLSVQAMRDDLDRNAQFFAAHWLPPAQVFAFPFGRTGPRAKALCARRFHACRGVQPSATPGAVDLALIPSQALYAHALSETDIAKKVADLAESGGFLSVYSHDVSDQPGRYDCTPGQLATLLSEAARHGIPVRGLSEALAARFGSAARAAHASAGGGQG